MKTNIFLSVILFLLFTSIYGQIPTSGLVAYWSFNGNANDSSVFLNNGTLVNGASFTADRFNIADHAMQLDITLSQYVSIPNSASLQIDSAISVSFWAKRNSLGGVDQVLNKGGDWPLGTCNYGLVFSEWTLVFIYNGGYYFVDSPGVPQDFNWHYYLVSALNGTPEVRFFVDGIEKTSFLGTGSNPIVNLYSLSSSDLYIGGINYFSNITMDDMRIYNRLLTESEKLALFYEGSVGILENNFKTNINVSPNPTNGNVTVDLGSMFQKVQIKINDLTGKLIMTKDYNSGQVFSIKFNEPSGMYFMTIVSEDKKATFRLIKK